MTRSTIFLRPDDIWAYMQQIAAHLGLDLNRRGAAKEVIRFALQATVAQLPKENKMDTQEIRQIAANIYDAQQHTVDEYDNPEAYTEALMELADENKWTDGMDDHDRTLLRRFLLMSAEDESIQK